MPVSQPDGPAVRRDRGVRDPGVLHGPDPVRPLVEVGEVQPSVGPRIEDGTVLSGDAGTGPGLHREVERRIAALVRGPEERLPVAQPGPVGPAEGRREQTGCPLPNRRKRRVGEVQHRNVVDVEGDVVRRCPAVPTQPELPGADAPGRRFPLAETRGEAPVLDGKGWSRGLLDATSTEAEVAVLDEHVGVQNRAGLVRQVHFEPGRLEPVARITEIDRAPGAQRPPRPVELHGVRSKDRFPAPDLHVARGLDGIARPAHFDGVGGHLGTVPLVVGAGRIHGNGRHAAKGCQETGRNS